MGIIILIATIISLIYVISNIKNKKAKYHIKVLISFMVFITCLCCTIYYFSPFNFKLDNSNYSVRVEIYGEDVGVLQEKQVNDVIELINEMKLQRGFVLQYSNKFSFNINESIIISLNGTEEPNSLKVYLFKNNKSDSIIEINRKQYKIVNVNDLIRKLKETKFE